MYTHTCSPTVRDCNPVAWPPGPRGLGPGMGVGNDIVKSRVAIELIGSEYIEEMTKCWYSVLAFIIFEKFSVSKLLPMTSILIFFS